MLKTLIEKKRTQMIASGMKYGLHTKQTLSLSQELDRLLNLVGVTNVRILKRHNNENTCKRFHASGK